MNKLILVLIYVIHLNPVKSHIPIVVNYHSMTVKLQPGLAMYSTVTILEYINLRNSYSEN